MEIRLANKNQIENEIAIFRKIDYEILKKIKPKWACGKDSDKVYDYDQHPQFGKYVICIVKITDLLENVEFFDFDIKKLFCEDIASDYRVVSTLKRWMKNQYVDPPTLAVNFSKEKKLSISDGRHRFKISHFLKLKFIPVAIHISFLEKVKEIIEVESI